MTWVAAAVIGGSLITGISGADAARRAANTQADASRAGIAATNEQFQQITQMLAPYRAQGESALGAQGDLAGTNGPDAQRKAIEALQQSPIFQSQQQQGEDAILANASATGGLRGGNTQGALAQFRPQLLAQTINDQYGRLAGLSSMGLGAAGQTGQFGASATSNVSNLLQQQGAAGAGGALAQGQAFAGIGNSLGQAAIFNRFAPQAPALNAANYPNAF